AADDPALPQLQARFLACYGEALAVATRPFPGVEDLLTALEARGFPWGVVTNKPARFTEPLLAALGLAVRAACVVSGDTTRHAKPHPEPLVYACKRLGLSPWRCWYLGDAERDIRAGRWAGMVTVAAEYGYIDPEDAPDLWGAHGLIAHPRELLPHLMAG
ncbi:MAG: HAD-IA family hydrolase, partial [Candidatus Competibacterales bacterium]